MKPLKPRRAAQEEPRLFGISFSPRGIVGQGRAGPSALPRGCSPRTCPSPRRVPGSPGRGWDALPAGQEQPSPARLHFPGSHPSSVCPGALPAIVPIPTPTFQNPPSSPGRIAGESSPPIPFPSPPLRWDQTRSGEGEEREGGEKKTKRSRGKHDVTHCS